MRITKPGVVPDLPDRKGKCTYCGCEFEFFTIEAKKVTSPSGEKFFSIKCPQEGCWFITTIPLDSKL